VTQEATYTIAVAGNPNSGKTTIFNALTGGNQRVGNYPGVTVEKKEGSIRVGDATLHFVDLPGTYSLTTYSLDEVVARQFIVDEKPHVVLDVVDACNLERNLYLALQLAEMGVPLVIALNMHDIAVQRGLRIDAALLSRLLGAPVIPTVGHRRSGTGDLLPALVGAASAGERPAPTVIDYGDVLEGQVAVLSEAIEGDEGLVDIAPPRWLAIKLLEADDTVRERIRASASDPAAVLATADAAGRAVERVHDDDAASLIAEHRYGHAAGIVRESVTETSDARTFSDALDVFACHRVLGPILMVTCIYVMFALTFSLADGWAWIPWGPGEWQTPCGLVGWFFDDALLRLTAGMAEGPLKSLIEDGVIGGVGGVIGFVPIIFFMFLLLAIIEDSGYIARIAFVLDRVLRAFGLQGKSILAMIVAGGIAGGCAVPGVMATRTLREEKDRLTTMLVAPFMNCGAKIPVYAMLIAAFFAAWKGMMMWVLALLSWAVALGAAYILRRTIIRGEQTPFVMELPPYHVPTIRAVLRGAFERSWMYVQKAGTIILAVSIVLWAMMYFPRIDPAPYDARREAVAAQGDAEEAVAQIDREQAAAQLAQSVGGRLGRFIEPVAQIAGFSWRECIALVGGFAAKEVVVSTLGMAYSMGEVKAVEGDVTDHPLARRIASDPAWNGLRAFALIIFVMVYAPCFVTVSIIWRESGSWRWALFATCYSTLLALTLATLVYQVGGLLGLGGG
jgi:ferrous iron transport protein B